MSAAPIRFKMVIGEGRKAKASYEPAQTYSKSIVVAKKIGFRYLEGRYDLLKRRVNSRLDKVVQAEIDYIAGKFVQYVFGNSSKPDTSHQLSGSLERNGFSVNLDQITPPWAPLNAQYIRRKNRGRRAGRLRGYFQYEGDLKQFMKNSDNWTTMFGPIEIGVTRRLGTNADEAGKLLESKKKIAFTLMDIRVRALTKITPAKLQALSSGQLGGPYPDGRKTGLIGLVADANPEMGYRLAGATGRVPYRASLEPFLGFLLTRSVPMAVQNAIQKSIGVNTFSPGANPRALGARNQ